MCRIERCLKGRRRPHELIGDGQLASRTRYIVSVRDHHRRIRIGRRESVYPGRKIDGVLTGGRRGRHPVEAPAVGGVNNAEVVVITRRTGDGDCVRCHRRYAGCFQLRDRELTCSWGQPKKDIRVKQAKNLGELGGTGNLALSARNGQGELELAVERLLGPIEVNVDVLQHPELARPYARTGHISAFAPHCARAEAQLHITYSLSKPPELHPGGPTVGAQSLSLYWRHGQTHKISTGTIAIAWSPRTPSSVSTFPAM